jgi:hypothetical protein
MAFPVGFVSDWSRVHRFYVPEETIGLVGRKTVAKFRLMDVQSQPCLVDHTSFYFWHRPAYRELV